MTSILQRYVQRQGHARDRWFTDMSAIRRGSSEPLRITVIGSGASGLAAAFRLGQAGHRVRILDQADRIGSTMRSRREHDFLLDQGAFFLTSANCRMLRIVEEAGLLDQMVPGRLVVGTLRDGKVHELTSDHFVRDLRRTKLLSPRSKLRLLRMAPDVRRARRHLPFDHAPRAAAWDGESVEKWARRRLGREIGEYVIGPSMRALHAAPAESRSPVELMSVIQLLLGTKLVAFRDGMGTYPQRLAERFEVKLRAEALEVVEQPDRVMLTWRDADAVQRVEAVEAVVLAVPAAAARKLIPTLDEWRAEFLGEVRDGHVINVNVASSWAPRGIGATYVQIPPGVHPFLGGIVLDHNKIPGRAPPGAGLLTLVALGDWSQAHLDDDDGQVGRELLNALESVPPERFKMSSSSRSTAGRSSSTRRRRLRGALLRHCCGAEDGAVVVAHYSWEADRASGTGRWFPAVGRGGGKKVSNSGPNIPRPRAERQVAQRFRPDALQARVTPAPADTRPRHEPMTPHAMRQSAIALRPRRPRRALSADRGARPRPDASQTAPP